MFYFESNKTKEKILYIEINKSKEKYIIRCHVKYTKK